MNLKILQGSNIFYELFEKAAENNFLAAKELQKLCKDFKNPQKSADKIHDLEHQGDLIVHAIFEQLNKSFVTPLDREDIIALTNAIDDIMDLIHTCADDFNNYYVKKPTSIAIKLADIILESTKVIKEILPKIRQRRYFSVIKDGVRELNHLETKADVLLKQGIQSLFRSPKKSVDIIRWQAIYQTMEDATDKCEDVADVLGGFLVKYA